MLRWYSILNSNSLSRGSYESMSSYMNLWPGKIREIERRNPVRLRQRPQLFANRKRDSAAVTVKDADLRQQMSRETIRSRRLGQDQQFGDYSDKCKLKLSGLIASGDPLVLSILEGVQNEGDHFVRLRQADIPKSIQTYEVKIERLIKQCRVEEAHEYLDSIMKNERVKPSEFMFSNIIKGYASVGSLDKCFLMYNQMKKMDLKPGSYVYTSLFEACYKYKGEKWYALDKATRLLGILRQNRVALHHITYKNAVKVFGTLGDIQTAFQLVDECPSSAKYDHYMLSSLLIACNSDSKSGFQLAISAWRLMRKKGVALSTQQYNLLLRTLQSGAGDLTSLKQLIQQRDQVPCSDYDSPDNSSGDSAPSTVPLSTPTTNTEHDSHLVFNGTSGITVTESPSQITGEMDGVGVYTTVTDILNPKLKLSSELKLTELSSPWSRLILLGGVNGVLKRMKTHNCEPDIKTFVYLLKATPNEQRNDEGVLNIMKKYGITLDADFYNLLMVRMANRGSYTEMWALLDHMKHCGIQPTSRLFSVLAFSCSTEDRCRQLLHVMKESEMRPELLHLSTMLDKTCPTNFKQLAIILEEMKSNNIHPDSGFLSLLQNKFRISKRLLVAQESGWSDMQGVDQKAMEEFELTHGNWIHQANKQKANTRI